MLFSYLLGMKTKLIFFSHKGDSFLGLQRGITAFVTLVLLDMIWFRYADYSKIITKKEINKISAVISWILLSSAIGVQDSPSTYKESFVYGALVGLVVYGVYNSSNYSILESWDMEIVIKDTLWGVFVCGTAAAVVHYFHHRFGPESE